MRYFRRPLAILLVCASGVQFATAQPAADKQAHWPQHLGPQRNGVSAEQGLLKSWPANGPKVIWRKRGGIGMSGLAIHGNTLVTMVQDARAQYVLALNATTGEPLWKKRIASAYRNGQGNGPRGTPSIVAGAVYAFTGDGVLARLALKTGKVEWTTAVMAKLKSRLADYGMSCSPLVHAGKVILSVGAQFAAVVACDAKTGAIVWKAGDDQPGYSSPILVKVGGKQQVVAFLGGSAMGVSAAGKVLWKFPYATEFNCNTATPVALSSDIFLSAGENHGSVRLRLQASGNPKVVWESQGRQSVLRSEWQTPVFINGDFYGMDNVGSAGPVTHLTCINAKTGKRNWVKLRFGKGNLIAADGKLFISTMKGELVVVRATSKEYSEMGRIKVLGSTRQAPSLARGKIYMRDNNEIVCVDVSK